MDMRNAYTLGLSLGGKSHTIDLGVGGRVIKRSMLVKEGVRMWTLFC